jgi:hypothetical protein
MIQHSSKALQIGFPQLMVSFSSALGPIQGHKVQCLISNLGQIEKMFFSISALTPSVKNPWD